MIDWCSSDVSYVLSTASISSCSDTKHVAGGKNNLRFLSDGCFKGSDQSAPRNTVCLQRQNWRFQERSAQRFVVPMSYTVMFLTDTHKERACVSVSRERQSSRFCTGPRAVSLFPCSCWSQDRVHQVWGVFTTSVNTHTSVAVSRWTCSPSEPIQRTDWSEISSEGVFSFCQCLWLVFALLGNSFTFLCGAYLMRKILKWWFCLLQKSYSPAELMEPALRVIVMIAQQQAGMWRRNGYSLINQVTFHCMKFGRSKLRSHFQRRVEFFCGLLNGQLSFENGFAIHPHFSSPKALDTLATSKLCVSFYSNWRVRSSQMSRCPPHPSVMFCVLSSFVFLASYPARHIRQSCFLFQIHFYHDVRFRAEMHDRDILLVQVSVFVVLPFRHRFLLRIHFVTDMQCKN